MNEQCRTATIPLQEYDELKSIASVYRKHLKDRSTTIYLEINPWNGNEIFILNKDEFAEELEKKFIQSKKELNEIKSELNKIKSEWWYKLFS